MMNALQLTDAGVGGLMQGLADIAERTRQRKMERAQVTSNELDAWKAYAAALEYEIERHKFVLSAVQNKYVEIAKNLSETRADYRRYANKLTGCLIKIDNNLQRQSANAHALTLMRDRLINKLSQVTDVNDCTLLSPEAQMEMHEKDWDDFMMSTDVRSEIPTMIEGFNMKQPPLRK